MKLMLVVGSVRNNRRADLVKNWAVPILQADSEIQLDIADLREVDLPFFDEPVSPDANNGNYENPKGAEWAKRVAGADGFVFLVAEYNHGPTAVLKNAIDWVYQGWVDKPVGFISYGGLVGGARAVEQLKQIVLHVKLKPVSAGVLIPGISGAFDENGKPKHDSLDASLKKLVAELKESRMPTVANR